jgi:hypothetical protein
VLVFLIGYGGVARSIVDSTVGEDRWIVVNVRGLTMNAAHVPSECRVGLSGQPSSEQLISLVEINVDQYRFPAAIRPIPR